MKNDKCFIGEHIFSEREIILNKKIKYCINCGCASSEDNMTIKPLEYLKEVNEDNLNVLFNSFKKVKNQFFQKSDYLKIRKKLIVSLKKLIARFELSQKTFFSTVEYLDYAASKLVKIDQNEIIYISKILLILSVKYNESYFKLEPILSYFCLGEFRPYELFLLKLLDYNLDMVTPFDIMNVFIEHGFILNNEPVSQNNFKYIYDKMHLMLYTFAECKNYVNLTSLQIGMGIIAIIRQCFGFEQFPIQLKQIYKLDEIKEEHLDENKENELNENFFSVALGYLSKIIIFKVNHNTTPDTNENSESTPDYQSHNEQTPDEYSHTTPNEKTAIKKESEINKVEKVC